MPLIKIDFLEDFKKLYKDAGHPLGKSRKGRKKWIKKVVIEALTRVVERENENHK